MVEDLPINLKLLCSYHGPVAQVCTALKINRQQFTKYLSGTSRPSRYNMRRICDFFGVDEHELLLPHDRFAAIIRLRPRPGQAEDPGVRAAQRILQAPDSAPVSLSRYAGWYFKYFYSFSAAGLILRSLVTVFAERGGIYYKTVERLRRPGDATSGFTFKYRGRLFSVGERLHMVDYEEIVGSEVSHTILYPSYLNRVSFLSGVMVGVSGTESHQPVAARVMMEYLGTQVAPRAALARCGLFRPDDPSIPAGVAARIGNRLCDGHTTLRSRPPGLSARLSPGRPPAAVLPGPARNAARRPRRRAGPRSGPTAAGRRGCARRAGPGWAGRDGWTPG